MKICHDFFPFQNWLMFNPCVCLQVVGAKVVTNARSPGALCYGFVTMSTSSEATKAINHLHRTELHGRTIHVEWVSYVICMCQICQSSENFWISGNFAQMVLYNSISKNRFSGNFLWFQDFFMILTGISDVYCKAKTAIRVKCWLGWDWSWGESGILLSE